MAYAIAETFWIVVFPAFVQSPDSYQPFHPGTTALLFAVYPLLGALASVCVAALAGLAPGVGRKLAQAMGPLLVLVAVSFALGQHAGDSRLALLGTAIALAGVVVTGLGAWDPSRWVGLQPLGSTWVAAFLPLGLVALPMILTPDGSAIVRLAIGLAYCIAVVVLAFLFHASGFLRGRQIILFASAAAASLAVTFAISQGAYLRAPRAPSGAAPKGPNVLLISMDTVRADHLSVYGYQRETSPNLRQLAAEATVYRHAVATADWTLPSHASIFTGLYPSEHGAFCDESNQRVIELPDEVETIAERLLARGYSTAGVVANIDMLSPKLNIRQGFQYFSNRLPATPLYAGSGVPSIRMAVLRLWKEVSKPPPNPELYVKASAISGEASVILNQMNRTGRPWFVFANYMDAHKPYDPPQPFGNRFTAGPPMPLTEAYDLVRDVNQRKQAMPSQAKGSLTGKYDGGIAYIDAQLGELFEEIRRMGAWDNTMILITSDHGEAFGEHELMDHGVSVYEDQIRVPLLIKWPRNQRPAEVPEHVSTVDIAPTVFAVAGVSGGQPVSGRSLLAPGTGTTVRIAESQPCAKIHSRHERFHRVERTVLLGSWKLIAASNGGHQLFDLETDPSESRNRFDTEVERGRQMKATLADWWKGRKRTRARKAANFGEEQLKRLKTLGYAQ